MRYRQQLSAFDEGVTFFMGIGQIFCIDGEPSRQPEKIGQMLLI